MEVGIIISRVTSLHSLLCALYFIPVFRLVHARMLISGGGATPGVRESSPEDVVAIHRTPSIFMQLLLDNLRRPSTVTHSELVTPMAAAELATNAITATEPEPVSAGDPASRSLFTLSILSPLDALRERLSHAKRRKDEAESRVRLLQAKRKSLRSLG